MLMSAAFLVATLVQFALSLVVAWLIGPAEFGRYALAIAGMALVQSLTLEWARLAATRYLSASNDAAMRAGFGRALAMLGGGALVLTALLVLFAGADRWLIALIPPAAWLMGFAEFRAARLRALFRERGYARFVLVRNLASALLMPVAAWQFGIAEAVLIAFVGAVVPALLLDAADARHGEPEVASEPAPAANVILAYAGPLVVTNLAYHAIFLVLRAFVAWQSGLAASGQFSLALDFLLKIVQTIGSALDLWLFQLAVKASREGHEAATRRQLDANAGVVAAALAPALLGVWLTLPSIEALLVAPAFRGGFSAYLAASLPALLLYGLIQYALHPFLQIERRTMPLAYAGLAALGGTLALLMAASATGWSGPLSVGPAMLGGFSTGVFFVVRSAGRPVAAPGRLARRLGAALLALAAATFWLRGMTPGIGPLLGQIALGGVAYCAMGYRLDVAGIATLIRERLQRAR